ncbi:MAG: DsbE family thiol:disulfide interchange protein [Pseudomonadales bacterium]
MSRVSLFVPLALFLLIIGFGYAGFKLNDPHELPSALLNKPFPDFSGARLLAPDQQASKHDLLGTPVLVNVWATWCPTCRAEHAALNRLSAEMGLRIVGVNYKDDPDKARRWLAELGNPYEFNVQDLDGSIGVELGVYGAPESFLLNAEGVIVYKRVGEVNERIWRDDIAPLLQQMRQAPAVGVKS